MPPLPHRSPLRPCPRPAVPGRFRARGAAFLLALLTAVRIGAAPPPASPPPSPTPPPPAFSSEVSVSWVLVPVIVRGRNGYVENLRREAFRLRVDGQPVAIRDFERRAEAPVSLVVLQDVSGSMEALGKLAASRRAISRLVTLARPGDEIALATFAALLIALALQRRQLVATLHQQHDERSQLLRNLDGQRVGSHVLGHVGPAAV